MVKWPLADQIRLWSMFLDLGKPENYDQLPNPGFCRTTRLGSLLTECAVRIWMFHSSHAKHVLNELLFPILATYIFKMGLSDLWNLFLRCIRFVYRKIGKKKLRPSSEFRMFSFLTEWLRITALWPLPYVWPIQLETIGKTGKNITASGYMTNTEKTNSLVRISIIIEVSMRAHRRYCGTDGSD